MHLGTQGSPGNLSAAPILLSQHSSHQTRRPTSQTYTFKYHLTANHSAIVNFISRAAAAVYHTSAHHDVGLNVPGNSQHKFEAARLRTSNDGTGGPLDRQRPAEEETSTKGLLNREEVQGGLFGLS
jgi:hypothetical protein